MSYGSKNIIENKNALDGIHCTKPTPIIFNFFEWPLLTPIIALLMFELKVGGQAGLATQHLKPTPWLTERHG